MSMSGYIFKCNSIYKNSNLTICKTIFSWNWKRDKRILFVEARPGIYRGKENNPADLEEVQHCLMGSQKDHLVIHPVNSNRRKREWCLNFESEIIILTRKAFGVYLNGIKSWRDETFSNFRHKFIKQAGCIAFQVWYRRHQSRP